MKQVDRIKSRDYLPQPQLSKAEPDKILSEVKLVFRAENFQTMSVQFDGNGMGQERNIFPAYLVLLIMFNKTLRLI